MASGAALAMTALLWLLLRRSWLGRAIVAVRMDRDAAALMGVRVGRIFIATFALGAALAGAAGALLGLVFPISPLQSEAYLGTAFTVCVLGGLGSVVGAIAGGVTLGLVESLSALYLGSENAGIVSLTLLLFLLAARPDGMFGKKGFS
jgi:branched-chain amino acid transport system permease protein